MLHKTNNKIMFLSQYAATRWEWMCKNADIKPEFVFSRRQKLRLLACAHMWVNNILLTFFILSGLLVVFHNNLAFEYEELRHWMCSSTSTYIHSLLNYLSSENVWCVRLYTSPLHHVWCFNRVEKRRFVYKNVWLKIDSEMFNSDCCYLLSIMPKS